MTPRVPSSPDARSVGGGFPRAARSDGCTVWADDGREFLDCLMVGGTVGLGYAHPDVTQASIAAIARGGSASLPSLLEDRVAGRLAARFPATPAFHFLRSGAEALTAAVALARAATRREQVLVAGRHGWLLRLAGSPASQWRPLPFNDLSRAREAIGAADSRLAAVVVDPVAEGPPDPEWLRLLRWETQAVGACLIVNEMRTALRVALGGAAERWEMVPDLVVLGRGVANGFGLAAVGGAPVIMQETTSLGLSTDSGVDMVALAAAEATLDGAAHYDLPGHLTRIGTPLLAGLQALAQQHPSVTSGVLGMPDGCRLVFPDREHGTTFTRGCAARGLLVHQDAPNALSLAHRASEVTRALGLMGEVLALMERGQLR